LPRAYSLNRRLILAASLVLATFLTLAGFGLYTLYHERSIESLQTLLLGHVYALLSAADDDEQGQIKLPDIMPDPRLNNPDSGLYAVVSSETVNSKWRSASLIGQNLNIDSISLEPGETSYQQINGLMVLHFGVAWEDLTGKPVRYTISIASSLQPLQADVEAFRKELLQWLGGSVLLLLLVQFLLLRWGLRPLKQASHEILQIEAGKLDRLTTDYPLELQGLTGNINSLIEHGRANQQRYRNSLGDLAHSLKTPLALMQGALDASEKTEKYQIVAEQLQRIDELVQYQLQRASLMGRSTLARSIEIVPVIEKIMHGLDKVYHDKQVVTELRLDPQALFHGDPADLMELLGNLLDNAYKYCGKTVRVTVAMPSHLQLVIEDDGNGIAESERERLLQRGQRADQQQPGQGIGLGIVAEIVRLYGINMIIGDSELGGAKLTLEFQR
jgi:two-component system sensor histidine kinase PhoQ